MTKVKVVLNRRAFGENIMAGPAVSAKVQEVGERVAAQVHNGQVDLVYAAVRAGGRRVRARVSNGTTPSEEARTNALTIALFNTVHGAKRTR